METGSRYTNQRVASYNPYLLLRFNAHINVESCVGYSSVKYVYKYVFKGPDMATLQVAGDAPEEVGAPAQVRDEVKEYVDARYVSAHEACWRIFEFKTHYQSLPVTALQIHVENGQLITIRAEQAVADRLEHDRARRTTLTAFFEVNARAQTDILYQDFPMHYAYNKSARVWRLRRTGASTTRCIGRVRWIPVTSGEVYYLRMLLVSVPGQRFFEDARTFEGRVFPTYREACQARGLLRDDREWIDTLEEAATFQLGRQYRELFASILLHCEVSDPCALWLRFADQLADDCEHLLRANFGIQNPSSEQAQDLALCYIEESLVRRNTTNQAKGIPAPSFDWLATLVIMSSAHTTARRSSARWTQTLHALTQSSAWSLTPSRALWSGMKEAHSLWMALAAQARRSYKIRRLRSFVWMDESRSQPHPLGLPQRFSQAARQPIRALRSLSILTQRRPARSQRTPTLRPSCARPRLSSGMKRL